MSVFATLVVQLAGLLDPVFAASATAAAIVLFTMLVRVGMHPLTRAAVRGEKARAALAPQLAALRSKYGRPKDADRLQKALLDLHAEAKVSPLAGCLPMLVQLPVFFVMYQVFSASRIGGEVNELLAHKLGAAPLGSRWFDALGEGGALGAQGLVFMGLFAAIAAVATWTFLRARRRSADAVASVPAVPGMQGLTRILPLLTFGTLVTAAVVPLAAGLYLLTTTAWTAAERAWLYRDRPAPAATTTG